jgi:hypothetical protein
VNHHHSDSGSWMNVQAQLWLTDLYSGRIESNGAKACLTTALGKVRPCRPDERPTHWQIAGARIRSICPRAIWFEQEDEFVVYLLESGRGYFVDSWSLLREDHSCDDFERRSALAPLALIESLAWSSALEYELQRVERLGSWSNRIQAVSRVQASQESKRRWLWEFLYPHLSLYSWSPELDRLKLSNDESERV